jgi:hypothetical protein
MSLSLFKEKQFKTASLTTTKFIDRRNKSFLIWPSLSNCFQIRPLGTSSSLDFRRIAEIVPPFPGVAFFFWWYFSETLTFDWSNSSLVAEEADGTE